MIHSVKYKTTLKGLKEANNNDKFSHYDLAERIESKMQKKFGMKLKLNRSLFLSPAGTESSGCWSFVLPHKKDIATVSIGYNHNTANGGTLPPRIAVSLESGIEVIVFQHKLTSHVYRDPGAVGDEIRDHVVAEIADTVIPTMLPETVAGIKEMKATMIPSIKKDKFLMDLGRLNNTTSSGQRFLPWERIGEIEKELGEQPVFTVYEIVAAFQKILKKHSPLRQIPVHQKFWEKLIEFQPAIQGVAA